MAALWLPHDDQHTLALREPNLLVPGRQPVGPVRVASDLIDPQKLSVVLSNGSTVDVKSGKQYTTGATIERGAAGIGRGFKWATGNSNQYILAASNPNDILDTTSCTMLIASVRTSSSYAYQSHAHGYNIADNNQVLLHLPWTNGAIYWDFGNTTTGRLSTSMTPYVAAGTVNIFAFVAGSRGREIWRNGVLLASDATKTATRSTSTSSASFRIGALHAFGSVPGAAPADITTLFVLSKEQWSPHALRVLTSDPYALFAPANDTPYLFSVGGGALTPPTLGTVTGVSLTPTTARITVPVTFS